jgi:hypothetical protein
MSIAETITDRIYRLEPEKQRQVLELVEILSQEKNTFGSGKSLLNFSGTIERSDLELMKREIEHGCEQIAEHEW